MPQGAATPQIISGARLHSVDDLKSRGVVASTIGRPNEARW